MLLQGSVGQPTPGSGGNTPPMRTGKLNDLSVSNLHGRYYEQTWNGNVFWGGNQVSQVTTVALAATYTGLVLWNPTNSRVNLALISVGIAVAVAEAAIATHGLITGFSPTGIVTHAQTNIAQGCAFIGSSSSVGTGVVSATATLTGTPVWTQAYRSGFTATFLQETTPNFIDLRSSIVLTPGAYAAIGTLTASHILGHFVWEEVPAF